MDFWISEWISDFRVDFWISEWISDFRVDFWISGFHSGFPDFSLEFGFLPTVYEISFVTDPSHSPVPV